MHIEVDKGHLGIGEHCRSYGHKKSASAHATHKSSACISEYKQLATRGSWGSESCLHIENTHRPSLASRSRSVIEAAPPDETNARARQVRGFGTEPHARRTAYFQRWKEPAHTLITAVFFHRFRTHIRRLSFQSSGFGTIRGGGEGVWGGAGASQDEAGVVWGAAAPPGLFSRGLL